MFVGINLGKKSRVDEALAYVITSLKPVVALVGFYMARDGVKYLNCVISLFLFINIIYSSFLVFSE